MRHRRRPGIRAAGAIGLALLLSAALVALLPSSGVPSASASHVPYTTTAFKVVASPTTAGELAEYVVTFSVVGSQTSQLMPANVAEVRITFDKDTFIPSSIPASAILMQASLVTNAAEIGTGCAPDGDVNHSIDGANQAAPLSQSPSFDTSTHDANRKVVVMKVPDMNPSTGTGSCGAGAQGIAAGARVTVTFTTAAGIKNESEQTGGSEISVKACSTVCGANLVDGSLNPGSVANTEVNPFPSDGVFIGTSFTSAATRLPIDTRITISSTDGNRGTKITVVAKGLKDGTTATFWLEDPAAAPNNVRDPGEADLATVVVGSDDIATATFTVSNPPFKPGKVNRIAVQDGRSQKATVNGSSTSAAALAALPNFELRGVVEITPTTVKLGDTITVQLRDFDGNSACNLAGAATCTGGVNGSYAAAPNFRLGGITVDKTKFSGTTTLNANGEATFTATVPNGVPIGSQAFEVRNACCLFGGGFASTRRFTLTVGNATLTLTPEIVVPNQTLSIVGNDFTTSDLVPPGSTGGVSINEVPGNCTGAGAITSSITIQGVAIPSGKINEGNPITVAAGGNWSASIIIPVNTTTTTQGIYDLKVTDCRGREGMAKLTIRQRTLAANPNPASLGSPLAITGSGYPARNDRSGSAFINVTIKYDAGPAGGVTAISVQPDTTGAIQGTLNVPINANIPSDNMVTTEFGTEAPVSIVINTVLHSVPRTILTLNPNSGPPGTKVSAAIRGARPFGTLSSAIIGPNLDIKPSPAPVTDAAGNLTFEFTVPLLGVGPQEVEVKIGNSTASAPFMVTAAPLPRIRGEPALVLHQDPDGRTGVKIQIAKLIDPVTGGAANAMVGAFQAKLLYDKTCLQILELRSAEFAIGAENPVPEGTRFAGFATAGVAAEADLAFAVTRLVGSAVQPCTLTLEIQDLTDKFGAPLAVAPAPVVLPLRRGDARADGNVDIADALFIAQYLVGLRPACIGAITIDCLHSVNAASVRQDGVFDETAIADALFIAQYLVGLRSDTFALLQ
jgi:hypothetical protein